MDLTKLLSVCAAVLFAVTAVSAAEANSLSPEAQKLQELLLKVPSQGILFGHHESTAYGVGWKADVKSNAPSRSDVKEVCGDYPAIIGWDLGKIEHGSQNNINGVPFDLIRKEVLAHYQRGGINMFCWHADNPLTGGDAWDVKDKTVVRSILPGGDCHEKFLSWLDKAAVFMNSITNTNGVKVPLILRPWHEHSGSWFWWGRDLCTTEQFKELWVMTRNHLRSRGCDQLIYAYSPDYVPNAESYMERYPGDEAVEILGYDCYHYSKGNDREGYQKRMDTMLSFLTQLGREHQKPVGCTETGFEALPCDDWWTGVLLPCTAKHSFSFLVVWRNAHTRHYYAPYPESRDSKDFLLYYQNPKTLFCSDLEKFSKDSEQKKD